MLNRDESHMRESWFLGDSGGVFVHNSSQNAARVGDDQCPESSQPQLHCGVSPKVNNQEGEVLEMKDGGSVPEPARRT